MNMINQAKISIRIDPRYDIQPLHFEEVQNAKTIFMGAFAHYSAYADMSGDEIISNALTAVWSAAKQYYAQHPEELHKVISV